MPIFDKGNTPNANGSKWLSFITITLFLVGASLPAIFHKETLYNLGFGITTTFLFVGTVVTADIGFKDTFVTHKNWKMGVQILSSIANVIVPAIFFAVSNNG